MNIRYLLKKVKLNEKEKEYLENKIFRLEKYFQDLDKKTIRAEVEVSLVAKQAWRVELMIKTPYDFYRAVKKGKKFFEAVDLAEGAIQQQIRRRQEKRKEIARKK